MIFVDTSFWVALRNRRDDHHLEAQQAAQRHSAAGLVTTNHVCGETWTFLRRRLGHQPAVDFLDAVEASPRVTVAHVSEALERLAEDWLRQRADREFSFVDATSFVFMRSERLVHALTYDGDFAAAGFQELREGPAEAALVPGQRS